MKAMITILFFVFLILFLSDENGLIAQTIVHVPSQFSTIQAAINNTTDRDTVLVADGVYFGNGNSNIDFYGKKIIVTSYYILHNDTTHINNTVIDCQNNSRGFYFHSGEDSLSILIGFSIKNGYANEYGGGIMCSNSSPIIKNCIITNCKSEASGYGAGIACRPNASPKIISCKIIQNNANGIYCWESSPMISDCIISNHKGISSGVSLVKSNAIIRNCIITQNEGHYGGAISIQVDSSPLIRNCLIAKNTANFGGAISSYSRSTPNIINCTIVENFADDDGVSGLPPAGGAIHFHNSSATILNSILWDNTPQEIYLDDAPSNSIIISFSDVQGSIDGIVKHEGSIVNWGDGNISEDPKFINAIADDYRLLPISPCIDSGDPNSPLDLDGTRTDIGAFYFDQSAGDIVPPTKPSGLKAIPQNKRVALSWQLNSEPDFSHTNIYRSTISGFVPTLNEYIRKQGKTNRYFIDDSVQNGTIYFYKINALDSVGNESEFSDEVSATPEASLWSAPSITIYQTDNPPIIDGKINESCWNLPGVATSFVVYGLDEFKFAVDQTIVRICYDDQALYLAYQNLESDRSSYKQDSTQRDGNVWNDDCDEFYFRYLSEPRPYYHLAVNVANVKFDEQEWDTQWDCDFTSATYKGSSGWFCEIALPFSSLGIEPPAESSEWNVNFCRRQFGGRNLDQWQNWAGILDGGFHQPESFGKIIFSGQIEDANPPSRPQNLSAKAGDNKITLTWSPNTETDLSHYKIYRSQTAAFTPLPSDSLAIVFKTDTVYVDTNVVNGTTYYYRISAVDSAGNVSEFSEEAHTTLQNYIQGNVSGIWTKALSPYYIVGSVSVDSGDTLRIEPGVQVRFRGKFAINVFGLILAIGTESDSIIFTRDEPIEDHRWGGLYFDEGIKGNRLEFCRFEYGKGSAGIINCYMTPEIQINNCLFYSNYQSTGGAICCHNVSKLQINNCLFYSNSASYGGAIAFMEAVNNASILNCRFIKNSAIEPGGAIWIWNSHNVEITSNMIELNTANEGGGIFIDGGGVLINKNLILNNKSTNSNSGGGGIYCNSSGTVISNNTIVFNSASHGAGLYVKGERGPKVSNCIFSENNSSSGGQIYLEESSWINLTYSCTEGENWSGIGNISDSPMFVNPTNGDFNLQSSSPCIDSGDPTSPLDPDGTRVDMGAFYFHQSGIDITPPSAPQGLEANSGDKKVYLQWNTNPENDLKGYKIYRSQSSGFEPHSSNYISFVEKPDTTYLDQQVMNAVTYFYAVSAIDSSGNESNFSLEASATPNAILEPQNILLSIDYLDFGQVVIDSVKNKILLVKNTGEASLVIKDINWFSPVFMVSDTSRAIQGSDSIKFEVTFSPKQEMTYTDTLQIISNDPDEPVTKVTLTGSGTYIPKPDIFLSTTSHHFGDVNIGDSREWELLIENNGSAVLTISDISCDNHVFQAQPKTFSINLGKDQPVTVTFIPEELKTETGTLTITSNDDDESTLSVALSGKGVDLTPAVISHISYQASVQLNEELQVSVNITDNAGVQTVELKYRRGGQSAFQSVAVTTVQNSTYLVTIPGSAASFGGFVFYFLAEDFGVHTTVSDTHKVTVSFADGALTTELAGSAYSGGFPRGQWRMISVPASLQDISVNAVFGDESELGSYGEPNWRLFRWEDTNGDGVTDDHVEFKPTDSKSSNAFTSGKAYWLKANADGSKIVIDTGVGQSTELSSQTITLQPGWNQIGTPFAFQTLFNPDDADIVNQLYEPDGTGGYGLLQNLRPWAGYFVYLRGNSSKNLRLSPWELPSLKKSVVEDKIWQLQLIAACGLMKDEINFVGISDNASNQWDHADLPEPPTIGNGIRLYFPHDDWGEDSGQFTADFRAKAKHGHVWDFVLEGGSRQSVVLKWQFNKQADKSTQIKLFCYYSGQMLDVLDTDQMTINRSDAETQLRFKLVAGSDAYISEQAAKIQESIPGEFALLPTYPNPFSNSTSINFQMAKGGVVNLIVFNLLGQKIKEFQQGLGSAGSYQISWDGRDERGRLVTSGVYVVVMRIDSFMQVMKVVKL